ncbi:MAG: hypothetical protein AUH38_03035 [Deltaproteobacteria bacterium 13_1_40CM_68_24]|nr:MAG: hypothetical protein AUH38_03035 [Deltaproteobacteria bacterium 13_1_40CM_68_24]
MQAADSWRALRGRSSVGYPQAVYTVIPWFAARRARRSLWQMLQPALTDRPTLLAVVGDKYTSEDKLRPFAPLAERFGGRLHVILAAEWEPEDREREGDAALRELGVVPEARRRLLRDEGRRRFALLLRQKQPAAVIEVFFEERALCGLDGRPDPRGAEIARREEEIVRRIDELLVRLPPAAPPPRTLQPGEHDFSPLGLCRLCGQGSSSLVACPGTKREETPRRDRFELIELD